jgi:hypothetical protein
MQTPFNKIRASILRPQIIILERQSPQISSISQMVRNCNRLSQLSTFLLLNRLINKRPYFLKITLYCRIIRLMNSSNSNQSKMLSIRHKVSRFLYSLIPLITSNKWIKSNLGRPLTLLKTQYKGKTYFKQVVPKLIKRQISKSLN